MKKFFLILLGVILFTSCSKDNPMLNNETYPFIISGIVNDNHHGTVRYINKHNVSTDDYLWAPAGIGNINDTLVVINIKTYRKYILNK